MKHGILKLFLLATLLSACTNATQNANTAGEPDMASLREGFAAPGDDARPWVFWFWINGNITRQGITADLEAMKRVGIGGVIIMEVDKGEPMGDVAFASRQWREMFAFMLEEAERLGIEVTIHNDAGWCGSGGPWIPVEKSMQKLTWSETSVSGPGRIERVLPQPEAVENYYCDIVTLAFPTPAADNRTIADYSPKILSSAHKGGFGARKMIDGNIKSAVAIPRPVPDVPQHIDFIFEKPYTANGVTIQLGGKNWELEGVLQISDDGDNYMDVTEFKGFAPSISFDFAEQKACHYRLKFNLAIKPGLQMQHINICEVAMSHHKINNLGQKAMFTPPTNPVPMLAEYPDAGPGFTVSTDKVLNISDKMKEDGTLVWDVPSGEWTVLRIGHTTTGKTNHTGPKSGVGFECDRLSKKASSLHFNNLIAKLAKESEDKVGDTFRTMHIDSWESGSQNWTPEFIKEFRKRRGYDPTPYLPVMAGQIIESKEISERFLWDVRATISDLMLENYTDNMRAMAHKSGLRLSIEAYRRCLTDEITYAGHADDIIAEFWAWPRYNFDYACTQMASAAHIYGKKVVGAEAFTSAFDERWRAHPANLKELGDWAFCEGINRFIIHRYAMQPYENIVPGMGMSATGIHFERTQTWWEMSSAWLDYLSRCQYLLQKGLFVADMCLLTPETLPQQWFSPYRRKDVAYRFDACSPEAALTRLSVKDGLIMLPDGMSYKILVMPESETMSPKLLKRIMELVADGATLVGAPPRKALGLADYPASDREIERLATELWGECNGTTITENRYGKGRVIYGKTPDEVLAGMNVGRDFISGDSLRFIHKRIDDTHIYFVANPKDEAVNTTCLFRVEGMQPELWDPMTGKTTKIARCVSDNGYVHVPLSIEPTGSVFVLFHPDNEAAEPTGDSTRPTKAEELRGEWSVSFVDGRGAPENTVFERLVSWHEHSDDGIRYYSGTALYSKKIRICDEMLADSNRITLDLGKVAVMAEVTVNGHNLGVLWKRPFKIDITDVVKAGDNKLEIKVVNLWINRLIGDEHLPESGEYHTAGNLKSWPQWVTEGAEDPSERSTFTTWKLCKKEDPLVESGLIGPVRLLMQ